MAFADVTEIDTPFYQQAALFYELAKIARENKYVRPEVVPREERCFVIKNGRWEKYHGSNLIGNDTSLDSTVSVEVLEGPNSSGKTFDLKKAIYIASMALSGMWIPADSARISVFDRIIFREKGTGDSMAAFSQDCNSVNECTPPEGSYWLIAMDETFTSTERKGGEALTYGLIRSIIDQGNSKLIISSHYPNLHSALEAEQGVQFNHFSFKRELSPNIRRLVTFPHIKETGPLRDYRYAITVALNFGFDERVLKYAQQRLRDKGY